MPLDLVSLASVRAAAERVMSAQPRVDILVNNAGVMAMPVRRTEDGFEMQLGVNHLGHWALAALLMPVLLTAPAARVVSVTSTAHTSGALPTRPIRTCAAATSCGLAYGQSKLACYD